MWDGYQLLLVMWMCSIDMIWVVLFYVVNLLGLFLVECWGGVIFDVVYCFLQECLWQWLCDICVWMLNLMMQMLLCVSNGVGYMNYFDNVVQEFVWQVVEIGVDVFCVFDSLNWVENMCVVMDVVVVLGKICEGMICYIGDIFDLQCVKYDLQYYIQMGYVLKDVGVYVLGLKDMVGFLKFVLVSLLVCVLKDEIGLLVYFYIYDIGGIGGVMIFVVVNVGVDVVDCVMDVLLGNISQLMLGLIVEVLCYIDRDIGFDIVVICEILNYWEVVCE